MVLTEKTLKYFSLIQYNIRAALVQSHSSVPFEYENESFFTAYNALYETWVKRKSQRTTMDLLKIGKQTLKKWETDFTHFGYAGLLPELSFISVSPLLEKLVILVKSCYPHERANVTLKLASALELEETSLEMIRHIQRCYGYGQRMTKDDIQYYYGLQHILKSVEKYRLHKQQIHDVKDRVNTFFNYSDDILQHRIELMKALSLIQKKRKIRPALKEFGVAPNRFYVLKQRYIQYGVWGLAELFQNGHTGEKISPQLELQIIEERLMNPSLSTSKMITKLGLKCCRANVQKIYTRWRLSRFTTSVAIRGVIAHKVVTDIKSPDKTSDNQSAKKLFPDLIQTARLKLNHSFTRFMDRLNYKKYYISNPGAFIIAPFLDQMGVVEALHSYGPKTFCSHEITNNIIVNVLRIIAGYPTVHDYTENSDKSVAIAAGLTVNPPRSRFYDSFDLLRFKHLQNLRNDAARRAKELGIIDGTEIAVDYHCDQCESRFPFDKSLSKAPDKNSNLVYAHRPQILWDSINNTIINIAYCEGRSRATSALYKFCEENLFKIIDTEAITEIYADSEYTGEKQLVYLSIRTASDITMCLKQNKKIKKWKEETIKTGRWEDYNDTYQIVFKDYVLTETQKQFRFIVKRNKETEEVRCFGSTHCDYSPKKILDSYHIRWPVETGIKDLIENYYLNKPMGTSPEKVEMHYYCIMLARLSIDYFKSVLAIPQWTTPEKWESVLSTIRTSIFSSQNCEVSFNEQGDFLLTYLDGDKNGIKKRVAEMLQKRSDAGLNKVSWWGNRGVKIKWSNQYEM